MLSQSSWVQQGGGTTRRYDAAYPSRSRRNVPYPHQPAYIRGPRRGPVPGPIRNPINSYRNCGVTPATTPQTNIIKKTISCPNNSRPNYINSLKIGKLDSRKKSLSMVDLSPVSAKRDVSDLRSGSATSLQTRLRRAELGESCKSRTTEAQVVLGDAFNPSSETGIEGFQPDTNKAAGLVCRALVVNAWRRRREDNSRLQETIRLLTQQVDHLHIQIVVLRRLLDTENVRVGKFMGEMQRVRGQFEEIVRDRDTLKSEKEEAIRDANHLREEASEKTVITENLRNELFTVKSQLSSIEGQISRDREKLLKLREDKKILLDKVAANETLASEHQARADRAEDEVRDLEKRLNVQITLLNAARDQQRKSSQELKLKTDETTKLRNQFEASQEFSKSLSSRAKNLEIKLSDRDAALRRLEAAYNSQLSETNDLRERLARQSLQEGGWSSRVLQIAGSVVRAPRAILRTLSLLSNSTGNSVTS